MGEKVTMHYSKPRSCPHFTESKEDQEVQDYWKITGYCKKKKTNLTLHACRSCKIYLNEKHEWESKFFHHDVTPPKIKCQTTLFPEKK